MNEADRQTAEPWYRVSFGAYYPLLYPHRNDAAAEREVGALVNLLHLRGWRRVLDVCCGGGRHLAALARLGFDAWGVDLSDALLGDAAQRPELAGRLVRADVRALPFAAAFDLAVNLFSSFGYFEDDRDNALALMQMVAVLRPGGTLVLDHANRPFLQANLQPVSRQSRDGIDIEHRRRIEHNRAVKQTTVRSPDGQTKRFIESVRLYSDLEMANVFASARLTDIRQFGSFDGQPLSERTDRMITIGIKQA